MAKKRKRDSRRVRRRRRTQRRRKRSIRAMRAVVAVQVRRTSLKIRRKVFQLKRLSILTTLQQDSTHPRGYTRLQDSSTLLDNIHQVPWILWEPILTLWVVTLLNMACPDNLNPLNPNFKTLGNLSSRWTSIPLILSERQTLTNCHLSEDLVQSTRSKSFKFKMTIPAPKGAQSQRRRRSRKWRRR